jgi:sensor histidine kinase YesM
MLTISNKYSFDVKPSSGIQPTPTTKGARHNKLHELYSFFIVAGIAIILPTLTGLMQLTSASFSILFQCIFFIGLFQIVYKGNSYVIHFVKQRFDNSKRTYLQVLSISNSVGLFYTGIICLSSFSAWSSFIMGNQPFEQPVIVTTIIILTLVLLHNNLQEIGYLHSIQKLNEEKIIQSETAKTEAEFHALTCEIDPHFMYNALTSLSYLLQQNPAEADNYNAMLAEQYRYVLTNKCKPLVPLTQELAFCQQYFSIQQLRFGTSIHLQMQHKNLPLHQLKVPPLSVQTLLENALKHNRFSALKPLEIQVLIQPHSLQVQHLIQPKTYTVEGTGTGLNNLNKRIQLLTHQTIKINNNHHTFSVTIPVIQQ